VGWDYSNYNIIVILLQDLLFKPIVPFICCSVPVLLYTTFLLFLVAEQYPTLCCCAYCAVPCWTFIVLADIVCAITTFVMLLFSIYIHHYLEPLQIVIPTFVFVEKDNIVVVWKEFVYVSSHFLQPFSAIQHFYILSIYARCAAALYGELSCFAGRGSAFVSLLCLGTCLLSCCGGEACLNGILCSRYVFFLLPLLYSLLSMYYIPSSPVLLWSAQHVACWASAMYCAMPSAHSVLGACFSFCLLGVRLLLPVYPSALLRLLL
jgi:hypothetical protein